MSVNCVHCGEDCGNVPIIWDEKDFCCSGCKTVYQLLNENQLYTYYQIEQTPGIKSDLDDIDQKFAYLDNEDVKNKLYEFKEGNFCRVTFFVPAIHCSSCIWLLENLNRLNASVKQSRVNFVKKQVNISFNDTEISLKQLVVLMASIHYIPHITLEDTDKKKSKNQNKNLLYKIGFAGFALGNTMLFSFPEYIQGALGIEAKYKILFGYLNLAFAIPVVLYSAQDYLLSAYKNLRHKIINIDFPIALGILAIFFQSSYEIISKSGAGYMDSLCGFVFFILIGKWYQNITYQALSFERDYKSYFPVAVTKLVDGKESSSLLENLKENDTILVHNQELIPADSTLIAGHANIDYSFVTGEAKPVKKNIGEMLYAGGRQIGSSIELIVRSKVEQSQLTKLWNQAQKDDIKPSLSKLIDKVSQNFTLTILFISAISAIYWGIIDKSLIIKVFSSVLIVACPCALSLSIPFAYGNTMRFLGKKGFYLKNSEVIEKLTKIDTVVFDKTGTITQTDLLSIDYEGDILSDEELVMIKSISKHSSHPLSTTIANYLKDIPNRNVINYRELSSQGLIGEFSEMEVKLGSQLFVSGMDRNIQENSSTVFVSFNSHVKGHFKIGNKYREGMDKLIDRLNKKYELHLISGDNDSERAKLQKNFKINSNLHFNQSPEDKMKYIQSLKSKGKNVLMIGDGLNDSGALNAANVSISIADDIYHFSPACDAILESGFLQKLTDYIKLSQSTLKVVKYSFILSFIYNIIGLSFAISGHLSPIVAAILMPLSSVSAVAFVTLFTSIESRKLLNT